MKNPDGLEKYKAISKKKKWEASPKKMDNKAVEISKHGVKKNVC